MKRKGESLWSAPAGRRREAEGGVRCLLGRERDGPKPKEGDSLAGQSPEICRAVPNERQGLSYFLRKSQVAATGRGKVSKLRATEGVNRAERPAGRLGRPRCALNCHGSAHWDRCGIGPPVWRPPKRPACPDVLAAGLFIRTNRRWRGQQLRAIVSILTHVLNQQTQEQLPAQQNVDSPSHLSSDWELQAKYSRALRV